MLRHDCCAPVSQAGVAHMDGRGERSVELIAFGPTGSVNRPTEGRWQSFGWQVVPESVQPVTS